MNPDSYALTNIMNICDVGEVKANKILKKIKLNQDYLSNIDSDKYDARLKNIMEVEANSRTEDISSTISETQIIDHFKKMVPLTILGLKIEVILYIILAAVLFYLLYALYINYQLKYNVDSKKPNYMHMRYLGLIIIFAIIFFIYYN